MAGYHGFSKSNNAIEAEANGRLPLSKWTKAAILAAAKRIKGTLHYLTWSGTRNRPKATECEITGYIEERGSFYYVYKAPNSKDPVFKKKVGSNGTQFTPAKRTK